MLRARAIRVRSTDYLPWIGLGVCRVGRNPRRGVRTRARLATDHAAHQGDSRVQNRRAAGIRTESRTVGAIALGVVVRKDPVGVGRFLSLTLILGGIVLACVIDPG